MSNNDIKASQLKNVSTGAMYGVSDAIQEVTNETQLRELESLVKRIRNDPETGYENLQKLEQKVKHLLQLWNNPPQA